jgi:hypothetical protein
MVKSNMSNVIRRSMEDNLAIIFMGIGAVFLVCHMPRLVLSLHEMWIINDTLKCIKAGMKIFPLWALILSHISHLFLVINSSVNSLIYCMVSSSFRKAAMIKAKKFGCVKNEPVGSLPPLARWGVPLSPNNERRIELASNINNNPFGNGGGQNNEQPGDGGDDDGGPALLRRPDNVHEDGQDKVLPRDLVVKPEDESANISSGDKKSNRSALTKTTKV